ncbi:ATPase [Prevotella pallens]|uniref:ATPase n=1 Tax=Prevotella pallens TaxID=60133 RepID=UPI001CB39302|nr:ATPase [Prevotella pallens]MBF1459620.1 ATPase [Prevotella pallens]MBF1490968.1 ATPase [Prevotella pallens]
MEPVYIDIHIHTSSNPEELNDNYDIETLFNNVRNKAQAQSILLSLTDHNTINKIAYLTALEKCGTDIHLILGVELHIHYVVDTEAYHCHMFFKNDITEQTIDSINHILDKLYPQKTVEKKDTSIPTLDKVINEFDKFDFVLLPHGGQSHATFNKAIPSDKKFDTMIERSIYYNQFDGFTARSDTKRDETDKYFQRLGISEFVNLITCSDNYDPQEYPSAKAKDAEPFIPTWMFSQPTFEGFRLSLSEKSRLVYSQTKPESWSENIEKVNYKNDKLDIDAQFSSGLNVIIGGSSSGKTLLADSIWRKLSKKPFNESNYKEFGVENINIVNPSEMVPHYLGQNYIMKLIGNDSEQGIENIEIIKSLFPDNREIATRVSRSLNILKTDLTELIQAVEDIETLEGKLRTIPQIGRLLVLNPVKENIISPLLPNENQRTSINYDKIEKINHIKTLKEIKILLQNNPFVPDYNKNIDELIELLQTAYKYSEIEHEVFQEINNANKTYAAILITESQEDQTKTQKINELSNHIRQYVYLNRKFKKHLLSIASYHDEFGTKEVNSSGHSLFIKNQYKINKEVVLEVFNSMLKSGNRIATFDDIIPQKLYENNFSKQKPKVANYDDFINRVYKDFEQRNKTIYSIRTKEGKDFNRLSAGWKTSVLLDLILGYNQDIAPIIIDQPEDNLATKYINDGLVKAIKKVKKSKQIILVSHNATIPMMGDAQQIIFCENKNGIITIRSASLEGDIEGKPVLDIIASITDGGKPSIKKRVKKYNLKKFTE